MIYKPTVNLLVTAMVELQTPFLIESGVLHFGYQIQNSADDNY